MGQAQLDVLLAHGEPDHSGLPLWAWISATAVVIRIGVPAAGILSHPLPHRGLVGFRRRARDQHVVPSSNERHLGLGLGAKSSPAVSRCPIA